MIETLCAFVFRAQIQRFIIFELRLNSWKDMNPFHVKYRHLVLRQAPKSSKFIFVLIRRDFGDEVISKMDA